MWTTIIATSSHLIETGHRALKTVTLGIIQWINFGASEDLAYAFKYQAYSTMQMIDIGKDLYAL